MNRLSQLLGRYRSKPLLIAAALLLFVLNLGRLAVDYYEKQQEEVASKIALLDQYQTATRKLVQLQRNVPQLEEHKQQLEEYLFSGESEDKITSAMQIKLQEQISKAGLELESLRPTVLDNKNKGKGYGEIPIKVRLSGTLNQFIDFLADFYRTKNLFRIESFTLKPYKQAELKLFIEFKGFYKLESLDSKLEARKV